MNTPIPLLIVDDSPKNLVVLESILDSPDYRLVMVQRAQEALRALLKTDFAAILLDVKMPDMTGHDLARLIHGRKVNRRLPIIFVSGHRTDETDVRFGYEAGGVDYVYKPFDPVVLRSKVEVFAELYRQRASLTAEAATLQDEIARLQQSITTHDSWDQPSRVSH